MVSTVQVPPPAPPSRPPRPRRSFAGPVVLIVLGVCFLLSNLGVISWSHFGFWFSHYWPVLLILWGVIKLIEYQQANRSGVPAAGIGAGGVLLVVFLVVAGLIATEAYSMNWQEIRDEMHIEGADIPWWEHTYNYTDELHQAFPAGDSLHVNSERGAINVTASTDNQIHVTVHKRINADRQEQADNWNKSTQPKITTGGEALTVDTNTHGAGNHWVSADLDIALPRKASVVISTRHGDVSIMGRDGNADITNQNGDVSVTDMNGNVTLNLDSSSARVSQVSSDVTIQGRAKSVSIEDVKGAVRLDGDFMESVKLARIAHAVSFKTSRTDMDFTRLNGDLNLDSGDLEATSVVGPMNLRTRSKDIRLNGVSSNLQLRNENGAVEIDIDKLGNLDVQNSRGDVRISIPPKSGFEINAQAPDGEIQSDFSEVKIDNGDNRATASGKVNGGGPQIVLKDDHGSIEIRKGVGNPVPPPTPRAPKVPNPPGV